MRYIKQPTAFNEQVILIISRGLSADVEKLEKFICKVDNYQFTGNLF